MNRIIDIPINHKIHKISWILLISWLGILITISCVNGEEKIASPISGETFFHGNFDLDMHTGKPVLINFWFPSCPPCRAEMPDLQIAFEKYGEDVAFIGIQQMGSDSEKMGIEFIRELGLAYPVMAISVQKDKLITKYYPSRLQCFCKKTTAYPAFGQGLSTSNS